MAQQYDRDGEKIDKQQQTPAAGGEPSLHGGDGGGGTSAEMTSETGAEIPRKERTVRDGVVLK